MKRSLILLLLVIVLAGYLGTLIARDPGYVLIVYDGLSLQTSLWVFLGLVLGFSTVFYFLVKLFNVIRRSPLIYQGWRSNQQTTRAGQLSTKGRRLMAEGDHDRARRFFDGAMTEGSDLALNLLAAARAANAMGDDAAREAYLREALEADAGMKRAHAVVTAELALERGEPKVALGALSGVKSNQHIATLTQSALHNLGDWQETLSWLPEVRKSSVSVAQELEKQATIQGLQRLAGQDDKVNELFKGRSPEAKTDAGVLCVYANSLSDDSTVEPLLRGAIKKTWHPDLVARYGELSEATLKARKKNAEGWQKQHADDSALQYCLGRIYEQSQELNLAKEAYAKATETGDLPAAFERYAALLAAEGQHERSLELIQRQP